MNCSSFINNKPLLKKPQRKTKNLIRLISTTLITAIPVGSINYEKKNKIRDQKHFIYNLAGGIYI